MTRQSRFFPLIFPLFLLWYGLGAFSANAESNVLFIFDASGSMKKTINGKTRINIARQSFGEMVLSMPDRVRLGLMIFGARRRKDCSDIQMISPVQANDRIELMLSMAGLEAKGETPIADAIIRGAQTFSSLRGQDNSIVVLTDGIEECHGDPCAAAAAVRRMGVNLKISIVGLSLRPQERRAIECVTRITGGQFYDASDADSLVAALSKVRQQITQQAKRAPSPPPPVAIAPPPPAAPVTIEKAPEHHRVRTVALLAPGKPYGSVPVVNWSITRVTDGKRESTPVVSTSTLSNTFNSDLPAGTYVVGAKVGLASGEATANVKADKDMTVDVVLNAGVVEIRTYAAQGVPVPSPANTRVRLDINGAGGAGDGTYGAGYIVAVPAGHWTVKAQFGNVSMSAPVDVEAGAVVKLPVVLNAGRLVLRGKAAPRGEPLEGVHWRVVSIKDGADAFGETYFTLAVFNLAAGDYRVTATRGQTQATETVTIHAGEVIEKNFAFPAKQ